MALATAGTGWENWEEVADWAYNSCYQLIENDTTTSSSGDDRIYKLGSCWGGFTDDGTNPSYMDTAVVHMCYDYVQLYTGATNPSSITSDDFKQLYQSSYLLFKDNQDNSYTNSGASTPTGLVTNWWRPVAPLGDGNGSVYRSDGTTLTGNGGTPANYFGWEAFRSPWRIMLDHALYGSTDASAWTDALDSSNEFGSWEYLSPNLLPLTKSNQGTDASSIDISGAEHMLDPSKSSIWGSDCGNAALASTLMTSDSQEDLNTYAQKVANVDVTSIAHSGAFCAQWTTLGAISMSETVLSEARTLVSDMSTILSSESSTSVEGVRSVSGTKKSGTNDNN